MTGARTAVLSGEQTWREDAACVGMDSSIFFIERGTLGDEARSVCASCPVQLDCLDFALANNEAHGIWGGKSERERQRLRRARLASSNGAK